MRLALLMSVGLLLFALAGCVSYVPVTPAPTRPYQAEPYRAAGYAPAYPPYMFIPR